MNMEPSPKDPTSELLLDLSDISAKESPTSSLATFPSPADATISDDLTDLTQTRASRVSIEAPRIDGPSRTSLSEERTIGAPVPSGRPSPTRSNGRSGSVSPTRPALKVTTTAISSVNVPGARTSVPRPQLSPPRRASSYQVRTPAENRYLSYRHVSAFQQLATSQKGILEDELLWSAVIGGERLPQPHSSQEAFDLEMLTLQIGEGISKTNPITANFNLILLSLLSHMRYMRVTAYDGDWATEAYNALFLVRMCVKYAVDNLSQIDIHEHFERDRSLPLSVPKEHISSNFHPTSTPSRIMIDSHVLQDKRLRAQTLLEELFHVVIYAEAGTPLNYDFYMETMNLLIVMASMQLKNERSDPGENLYFLEIMLDRLSHFAGGAMARLLSNFINKPPPLGPAGGMLYSAYSYLFFTKRPDYQAPSPIGDKSALLFLILLNQNPKHFANEFKEALKRLEDTNVSVASNTSEDEAVINVSFRQMYQTLSSSIATEESCLIFYPLLVHNRRFRTYIMSRSDPESLMLPALKAIFEFSESKGNFAHLYMLLIILLLLSQDEDFLEGIQKITVQTQTWYTERVVKSISLSGLCMLILIRTVQTNLSTYKDVYCHTLSSAILANLSNNVLSLNSVVAQRVVSFYEMVAKRYIKLINSQGSSENLHSATPWKSDPGEVDFDTLIYGDLVALLLEMMNSIVCRTLKHNPELVYALLQKREAFAPFREMPRFRDLVENIDKVIAHFHQKLQQADLKIMSTLDVGDIIDRATKTWSSSSLKTFSTLKFRYEESPQEWQFSIPYVWRAVSQRSLIYWDAESATLVNGFADERLDNLDQIL